MTREHYRQARRLLRQGGVAALVFLGERGEQARRVFAALESATPDLLSVRSELSAYFAPERLTQALKNEIRARLELCAARPRLAA